VTRTQLVLAPALLLAGLASLGLAVVTINSFGLVVLAMILILAGLAAADTTGRR
jgi:hypothetical protein